LREELGSLALGDTVRFAGGFVADAAALGEFAGHGPLNTDDRPWMLYGAPRMSQRRDGRPSEPLMRLLDCVRDRIPRMVPEVAGGDDAFRGRVGDYLRARDEYLKGLVADGEDRREEAVAHYVESARVSGDFTAGYARCLTMASMLAGEDRAAARRLLEQLIGARPSRPVAGDMLRRLEAAP
jgi:spermidine synthase